MARRRVATQFGAGTSLRREDYTEAAARAVRAALWRNALTAAELFGMEKAAMRIDCVVAVARPERVDRAAIAALFPYGEVEVRSVRGGLDVPKPEAGGVTVVAQAAVAVSFEMEPSA